MPEYLLQDSDDVDEVRREPFVIVSTPNTGNFRGPWVASRACMGGGKLWFEFDSEVHDDPVQALNRVMLLNDCPGDVNPLVALRELFARCFSGTSGGERVIGRFLLGLYDGDRFPFDLQTLGKLDEENFDRVESVLRFNRHVTLYVHDWLNVMFKRDDFGMRFEHMAWRLGMVDGEMPEIFGNWREPKEGL